MSKLAHPDMVQARGETEASQNRPKPQTYVVDDPTSPAGPPGPAAETQPQQPTVDDRLAQFAAPPVDTQTGPSGAEYKLPEKRQLTKALEKLIFIGRISKEIEIADVKFELSTLTNKEHNEIVHMMYGFTDPADLFTIRLITLASALRSIDGVPVQDIDIEGEFESDLHQRMSIIDHLQLSVVEALYDEYEKLTAEEEDVADENEEIKN